jgi:hypothetical protein
MDDSGTHADSPICVLAGYFGGEKHWVEFERQWWRVLKNAGVSEFHAKRFWARTPNGQRVDEYKDWSEEQANSFIQNLLDIIGGGLRLYPVGCAVVMADWHQLPEPERRYLTGGRYRKGRFRSTGAPNKPYFLPFIRNIGKVASYCADDLKVHFAFDRNEPYSGYALDYYKTLNRLELRYWQRCGRLDFPTSKEAAPLQAADLLAYKINQYAQERLAKGLEYKHNPDHILFAAMKKLRNPKQDFKLFDKRGFAIVLTNFRKVFRDAT